MSLLTGIVSVHKLNGNSLDVISTTSGTDTAISYVAGKKGQAASFNGTSSIIGTINTTGTYSFIHNTNFFSISFWAKRTSIGSLVYLMGNTPTSLEKGFFLEANASNGLRLAVFDGGGSTILSSTVSSFFIDTEWNMITLVRDGSTLTFYRNTTPFVGSTTGAPLTTGNSSRQITFGQISNFSSNFYAGLLDNIMFWSRALTASEVQQLYNNGNGLEYPFNNSNFFLFM